MDAFEENPFFLFLERRSAFPVTAAKGKIVELSDTGCDTRPSLTAFLQLHPHQCTYPRKLNTTLLDNRGSRHLRQTVNDRRTERYGGQCQTCTQNRMDGTTPVSYSPNIADYQRPMYDYVKVDNSSRNAAKYRERLGPEYATRVSYSRAPMKHWYSTQDGGNLGDAQDRTDDFVDRSFRKPWKSSGTVSEFYKNVDYDDTFEQEMRSPFDQNSRQAARNPWVGKWKLARNAEENGVRDFQGAQSAGYPERFSVLRENVGRQRKVRLRRNPLPESLYEVMDTKCDSDMIRDTESRRCSEESDVSQGSDVSIRPARPRFVDRGVDRESLLNVSKTLVSSTLLDSSDQTGDVWEKPWSPTKVVADDDNKSEFWEFIPMDRNSAEMWEPEGRGKWSEFCESHRTREEILENNGYHKYPENRVFRDSASVVEPGVVLKEKNEKFESEDQRIFSATDFTVIQDETTHQDTRDCSADQKKHVRRSIGKSGSVLKRVDRDIESVANGVKRHGILSSTEAVVADSKPSFLQRTSACVKRKFGYGKPKRSVHSSTTETDPVASPNKKRIRSDSSTYSRLPIRVGPRIRSKDPKVHSRNRSRTGVSCGMQSDDVPSTGKACQQGSIRSRTKPLMQPSVPQPVRIP